MKQKQEPKNYWHKNVVKWKQNSWEILWSSEKKNEKTRKKNNITNNSKWNIKHKENSSNRKKTQNETILVYIYKLWNMLPKSN